MNNQGTMRIGEVHAILRRDVPDIELSKIRYYEDKGLVQPTRSRKGYRLYSQRDVECLREAIRLAHEEFVPLRVVRLRLIEQGLLDDTSVAAGTRQVARATAGVISVPVPSSNGNDDSPLDESTTSANSSDDEPVVQSQGMTVAPDEPDAELVGIGTDASSTALVTTVATNEPVGETRGVHEVRAVAHENVPKAPIVESPSPPGFEVTRVSEVSDYDDDDRYYSPAEFLSVSGLEPAVMNQLVAIGLLSPETVANQSTFNQLDLRVARAVKVLLARNIDVRLLGSLRRNVEREIGLLNDVTAPVRPSKKTPSAREAHDTARTIALEISALRAELFARSLHKYLGH
jgi:DNA-binding transcriptional MerR regulator